MYSLGRITVKSIKFRAWHDGYMCFESMTSYLGSYGCQFAQFNSLEDPLMQFTGLVDKNGVDIYEGDIVRTIDEDGKVEKVGEIEDGGCDGFYWCNHGFLEQALNWAKYKPEVIGNIYENKELLTNKESK